MRFAEDATTGRFLIRAYGPGQITVNDEVLTRSLIISVERLIRDWAPQGFEELTAEHLRAATALDPEILLLGTGARQRLLHPRLIADLQGQGIGVEVMDTASACRTYNILAGESRRVSAALLMI
ncbi:MAG: Mth938-like domain-containing protein [Gammaproteobacteria bacterium]